MSTFELNRTLAGASLIGGAARMFGMLADWNDARITRKALSKLSDRELDDIGLTRADIETLARAR